MKGPLVEGVIAPLLRDLYVHRRSGTLTFRRGDEWRAVRLRKGHVVHASTNVREDQMGEVLVRSGALTDSQLERSAGFALRDRKRLGQVLVEQGLLPAEYLGDAVALHVHEVLAKVFSWRSGQYEFADGGETEALPDEITLKVSTGQIILEAARGVADLEVVRDYLGDVDRLVVLSMDPLLRFQRLTLTPGDGYVLSRVDGTCSAREIIAMSPLAPEETQRCLFALLSTGMVEYAIGKPGLKPKLALPELGVGRPAPPAAPPPAPPPPPPPPPPAAPASAPAPPLPLETVPETGPMPAIPPPSPAPPVPPAPPQEEPAEPPPSEDPRRLEILEMHSGLERRTHFEILGVARDATEAQVREAYFRLARRFHPDVHHDPALADLRDAIEAVFVRLGEAYEALSNPRSRASYEAQLRRQESDKAAPAAVDAKEEARLAEEAIRRGARSVAEERYWEAIRTLEPAILRASGPVRQEGRVLLARAYSKNVNWVKQGEELLQAVLREDPRNLEAMLLLADIYRAGGLKIRAAAMLRRALEVQPGHEPATAALEALATEEPAGARAGRLKKMFHRG